MLQTFLKEYFKNPFSYAALCLGVVGFLILNRLAPESNQALGNVYLVTISGQRVILSNYVSYNMYYDGLANWTDSSGRDYQTKAVVLFISNPKKN